jgi:hypothetical protein
MLQELKPHVHLGSPVGPWCLRENLVWNDGLEQARVLVAIKRAP